MSYPGAAMRGLLGAALSLSILAGCGGDDGPTPSEAKWQLLGERRPSSLLAVWAGSVDNVWVVGGREGLGNGPTVLHYDGTAWTKLDTGLVNVDLWSVFGFSDQVFLAGSNGTLLRYRNNAFETLTAPANDIVFGLWGSAPDDVWAVGGQNTGRAFAWHFDGTAFTAVAGVPADLVAMGTVWKVTGRAANDVYMSGSRGTVLHWDGSTLTNEVIGGTEESLFSIGCGSARCVTAGTNLANGVLYENAGAGWASKVPTPDGPVWRGMTPTGDHPYVVGMFGAVLRLDGDKWVADQHKLTSKNLHAAWTDADGNVDGNLWAVGGDFDRAPSIEGVLLFKGVQELPTLP